MADAVDVAVELEKKCELHTLLCCDLLDQDTFLVQSLLQDLRPEPVRDQRHLKITGIAVIGHRAEIHDTVGVKRCGLAFCIKRETDRTGNCPGCRIVVRTYAVLFRFCELCDMNVFQVVFNFISHVLTLHLE